MKNNTLKYLILILGISLAIVAGFFSVTGLSKLFSGASIAIIVMAGVLEISKIVLTVYLHNNWKTVKILNRIYLTFSVIILMGITSLGIYGFIINAYQGTADKLIQANAEIGLLESNKSMLGDRIIRYEGQIEFKNTRIQSLSEIRSDQEVRLDSLYKRRFYTTAKRVEQQIKESNDEIQKTSSEIDSLNNLIFNITSQQDSLDRAIIQIRGRHTSGEIGPLIYMSELTGKPMDTIVNWFVLIFVIVFDPLALSLIVAYNKLTLSSATKEVKKGQTDVEMIMESIENPPEPNEELKEAAKRYKELTTDHPEMLEEEEEEVIEEQIVEMKKEMEPEPEPEPEPPPPPPKPKPPRRGSYRKINR